MPANELYDEAKTPILTVGASVTSGSFGVLGQVPYVALGNSGASNTPIACATRGIFNLSVHGYSTVNAAVNIGDIVYFDSGDSNKLNVHNTGVRFGYALGAVTSGSNTTIPVMVGY